MHPLDRPLCHVRVAVRHEGVALRLPVGALHDLHADHVVQLLQRALPVELLSVLASIFHCDPVRVVDLGNSLNGVESLKPLENL